MNNINEIELFKNLSEWDFDPSTFWDLHNDFDCVNIELGGDMLLFDFLSVSNKAFGLRMEFRNAEIKSFTLSVKEKPLGPLTLDNLHRGRFQVGDGLVEFDEQDRGYFYLEFYEGLSLEFWSEHISLTPK